MGALCSQWIACSPERKAVVGRPLNSVVRLQVISAFELAGIGNEHLANLEELMRQFQHTDLILFAHHYIANEHGSFQLTMGTSTARVRFSWNGEQRYLSMDKGWRQDQQSELEWRMVPGQALSGDQSVYQLINEKIAELLAI